MTGPLYVSGTKIDVTLSDRVDSRAARNTHLIPLRNVVMRDHYHQLPIGWRSGNAGTNIPNIIATLQLQIYWTRGSQ